MDSFLEPNPSPAWADGVVDSGPPSPYPAAPDSSSGIGVAGSSGLMRVLSAGSGAPGSFRIALLTGLYSGSGFLCPPCAQDGEGLSLRDEVDHVSANLYMSATPLPYLEAYLAVYSHGTSTNRPEPRLRQVVGDWSVGAKVFQEIDAEGVWSVGGNLDVLFATGTGQVGVPGIGATNLALRGLATLDLTRSAGSLPLRGHLNLGYTFDNSAKLLESFESENAPIDRVQRFSLGINRVDQIAFGLGVEGMMEAVRPFIEWSVEVPANYRQSYRCSPRLLLSGDNCLEGSERFGAVPSRLSLGVRARPWESIGWWVDGLGVLTALDVGTGATADFLAEVRPEVPWKLWAGVSYSVSPSEPAAPKPAAPARLPPGAVGRVVDGESGAPIAGAQVHFNGRDLTGLITAADGSFTSAPLRPDVYPLSVTAEGYERGSCQADLRATAAVAAPNGAVGQGAALNAARAPAASAEVTCELQPLPQLASLIGYLLDSVSREPVSGGNATITDTQGRPLSIVADARGAFGFENIVPGRAVLEVVAPGYLRSMTSLELAALQKLEGTVLLTPRPARPRVRISADQVLFEGSVAFNEATAALTPESLGLLEEMCAVLLAGAQVRKIAVRSHTGESGPTGQQLSVERANVVRELLLLHGFGAERVAAEGVGNREPLVAGVGEAARRQNERLEVRLVGQPSPAASPQETPSPIQAPALEPSKVLEQMLGAEPE